MVVYGDSVVAVTKGDGKSLSNTAIKCTSKYAVSYTTVSKAGSPGSGAVGSKNKRAGTKGAAGPVPGTNQFLGVCLRGGGGSGCTSAAVGSAAAAADHSHD